LARSDSVVAVATDDEVFLIDPRRGRSTPLVGASALRSVAPIYAVAIDARSIWVGGAQGVVAIDRANGGIRPIIDPRTPVQAVYDVVLQPGLVWLATPAGLVRLRRLPDGGVR
jgi:ligand-binding sensor domain-containing protein